MKPASLGIVQNDKKELLLVQRRDVKIWVLPGGGIEDNESPEEACIREVAEESSVTAKIVRKAATLSPVSKYTSKTHIFFCTTDALQAIPDTTESLAAQFFPLEKLPSTFFFIHKNWLFECLHSNTCIEREITEITPLPALFFALKHPLITGSYLWTRIYEKFFGK